MERGAHGEGHCAFRPQRCGGSATGAQMVRRPSLACAVCSSMHTARKFAIALLAHATRAGAILSKRAARWKPPASALQRDCASGSTPHPDMQAVANGLPLNAAERPPNRTALRALGGHRTLRWRNPGALACCACFRRFTILIERDRWAGGGHLIWARSQPLGLMWVGGGAEPTSLWYGPACANFALREIGPKDKHGE